MPEGPEVELDKQHETIHEEFEKEGGSFLKQISLTTAVLAVLAALASLQAGTTVNMALALRTEAVQLQSQASDQWSYYQAKGIKSAVQEASRSAWLAVGKEPPLGFEDKMKRYQEEQVEISNKAKEKEKERDERMRESEHLLHKHHGFAKSVTLFQVSIALGAVAALTRSRSVWVGSLLAGAAGLVLFILPFTY
ncbi:DUF4337 domain-containing protein [Geomonas sp.]|uniref:DUF4337 domain-containing protein n=1 Tax=Geomonas sp. TaxID=2651584 RepID=UPI002B4671DA|nr:DUF4337 domain-containing protein [Geomonas sp.]HJV35840.1 DUF4337 domain-containing protein [Geomonas sp.]